MEAIRIDLCSDTITRPTPEMRKFISSAEVGDEQKKEDPTVNRLVEMVCELLDKEDALFLPSGTMCNQVAIRVHCSHGDEIVMDKTAHTRHYETGGPAALTGASTYTLEGERGIFSADQFEAAIRPDNNHFPRTRMVLIEQTSNMGGGSIWPLETIRGISQTAVKHGIARHMDGARLLNAVIATGIPAREYAAHFDSIWIDFSKGLGAPVGAAIAGSKEFIKEAWRWKHQFGGAMRQAGIIAAGAVYALEHHVERLSEDHENARILAKGLADIDGIRVEPVETNLLFFDVSGLGITGVEFNRMLMAEGVRVSPTPGTRVRAVTHLDVTRSQVEEALDVIRGVADDIRT
ncbi:MAG: aminotransferase class I/II-fold pyridoxal phosphate-dependent enzyme [Deltaproteobacteria bacterium]|nr:aminotransferase class I/II-fold pyridoxal phosphate-dependent enzyme [Deltaproteobacteria bacterium]MBW2139015.1 aminotransferase class I/II-fold pyridoxal phosphate-dependent enzyme [Deltaproteobacteria bacterium]